MEALLPGLTSAPNSHPMLIHFPISFWVAGAAAWAWAAARKGDQVWRFGTWLHTLGATTGAVATIAGFLASESLGHDAPGHDLVHVHRDIMLAATLLSIVSTVLAWWKRDAGRAWRAGLALSAGLLVVVASLGADRGALLVYGHGVGVAEDSGHPAHAR